MSELTADELEVYRLVEEARAQYDRYISTTDFVPMQENSSDDIGHYDWRHPVTIYTGSE